MLGTRTRRPSDAPIPLCLCETPASTIPRSGSIAGGMAPDYLSPQPVEWFKRDSGIPIGRGAHGGEIFLSAVGAFAMDSYAARAWGGQPIAARKSRVLAG